MKDQVQSHKSIWQCSVSSLKLAYMHWSETSQFRADFTSVLNPVIDSGKPDEFRQTRCSARRHLTSFRELLTTLLHPRHNSSITLTIATLSRFKLNAVDVHSYARTRQQHSTILCRREKMVIGTHENVTRKTQRIFALAAGKNGFLNSVSDDAYQITKRELFSRETGCSEGMLKKLRTKKKWREKVRVGIFKLRVVKKWKSNARVITDDCHLPIILGWTVRTCYGTRQDLQCSLKGQGESK